jgi:hypothetical protein
VFADAATMSKGSVSADPAGNLIVLELIIDAATMSKGSVSADPAGNLIVLELIIFVCVILSGAICMMVTAIIPNSFVQ